MKNKGFTLLEMVLTIGIISILLAGVAVIFPQWVDQYILLKQTAAATEIMDAVASGIQQELAFSQDREWSDQGLTYVTADKVSILPLKGSQCTITYAENQLVISGQPRIYGTVFDQSFYKDMTVTLTMQEEKRSRDGAMILMTQIQVYSASGKLLCSETKPTMYYNP